MLLSSCYLCLIVSIKKKKFLPISCIVGGEKTYLLFIARLTLMKVAVVLVVMMAVVMIVVEGKVAIVAVH